MLMLFIFKEQLVTVAVGANLVVCEHYVTVVPGSEKAAILCECTESVRWMSRRKWIHPLIGPCGPFGPFVHIRCSSCLLTQYAPLLSSQFLAEETSTDTSETTLQPRLLSYRFWRERDVAKCRWRCCGTAWRAPASTTPTRARQPPPRQSAPQPLRRSLWICFQSYLIFDDTCLADFFQTLLYWAGDLN